MQALDGVLWIVIALLTTRRIFRIAVPPTAKFPTMGNYVISWILIVAWWYFLAYAIIFIGNLVS